MKRIIENRLYDTNKAYKVKTFYRTVKVTGTNILGMEMTKHIQREIDLYRTPKGNWFEHRKEMEGVLDSKEELNPIATGIAREILKELGDVENYEKYFERLEMA